MYVGFSLQLVVHRHPTNVKSLLTLSHDECLPRSCVTAELLSLFLRGIPPSIVGIGPWVRVIYI